MYVYSLLLNLLQFYGRTAESKLNIALLPSGKYQTILTLTPTRQKKEK